MPYRRDGLTRMVTVVDTFETAATWEADLVLINAVRTEVGATAPH
ncbi:hypothetical protein [Streptomyces sp. 142MFCol3.1]|nr:hypothetical protein [Streptomyces sp. 142MFCol3.1]